MEFRIADTFTDSLAKLTGDQQKAVKTSAFDLQMNPEHPGLQLHKIDKSRDKNFWSARVSRDIRIILHRTDDSLMLCYVDHHDEAYRWAERRRLERHPRTGAAQIVEVRETVREIEVPRYVDAPEPEAPPAQPLFTDVPDDDLLGYGVPTEWLSTVRTATEDSLFDISDHLPQEAAEALLELATGNVPEPAMTIREDVSPFAHPDAQRRFRVMTNVEELERALDAPWEKWAIFLHPDQRQLVERDYSGPARVSGSAGTGKTVVALHRAVHLARTHPETRILLATFSDTLANALRGRLRLLLGNEPRIAERLETLSMSEAGRRIYEANFGTPRLATEEQIRELLRRISEASPAHRFSEHFLWMEWSNVVDAWQLETWEEYRDVRRLGRRTRLAESQRQVLWSMFSELRAALRDEDIMTEAELFGRLTQAAEQAKYPAFEFAVIDEAQDISVPELRFLAAMGAGRENGLFFAGDLGQRIFQQPFSWKALGVEIQGRSRTLRVNYRTSHQIRQKADQLLDPSLSDVDGNVETRGGTISVFDGVEPVVMSLEMEQAEKTFVAEWVGKHLEDGIAPHEIAVFVRSDAQLTRAESALERLSAPVALLDERMQTKHGSISLTTMHLAKGLEFRAVAVMACDDDVVPLEERLESAGDSSELEDAYQTERHLLYVACTRARDHLLVTGVEPASEFLDDLA